MGHRLRLSLGIPVIPIHDSTPKSVPFRPGILIVVGARSANHRSRRIDEFLKELDLTKGRSTGISKILKVMADNGSPSPEFETDEDRSNFLIRLPVHDRAVVAPAPAPVGAKAGTKLALSRHQAEILNKCGESAVLLDLMVITGRSDRTKFRHRHSSRGHEITMQ